MRKTPETGKERQARLLQMRKEQESAERRRRLLGVLVLVVVLVALVIAVVFGVHSSAGDDASAPSKQILPASVDGPSTSCTALPSWVQAKSSTAKQQATAHCTIVQPKPSTVPNQTGIPGVVAYDTQGWPGDGASHPGALAHDHVLGRVKYAVTPPVGGDHNPVWMNAGVYTEPVPSERAVHNLEHGAVWITYRPNLPADQVKTLQDFVGKQSMITEQGGQANRYMDLSPWQDNALPSPIVLSAWGYQLKVDSPTDPRMQEFVDMFRHNQKYTPEFGAAVDGIPVRTGGEPPLDGSKFANPSGAYDGQGM